MIRKYLIVITVIVAVFYLLNSQDGKRPFTLVKLESVKQNPEKEISDKIDQVFAYFRDMDDENKVDLSFQKKHFTSDFKMIVNGKEVVTSRDEISDHIDQIKSQTSKGNCIFYDKIPTDHKCVMQYDLETPGLPKKKVMAIYKFRNGKICEMDELLFSANDD